MNSRLPALAAHVSYQAVRDYLVARRWQGVASRLGYAAIYRSPGDGEVEVQIPLDPELADYADAITLAARRISGFEGRTQEEVLLDLLRPRSDTIRFVLSGGTTETGTIRPRRWPLARRGRAQVVARQRMQRSAAGPRRCSSRAPPTSRARSARVRRRGSSTPPPRPRSSAPISVRPSSR